MKTFLQILLIAPATLLAPLAWFMFPMLYSPRLDGPPSTYFLRVALFIAGSGIGLLGLWAAIFTANPSRRARRLILIMLLTGMGFEFWGFVMAASNWRRPPEFTIGLAAIWLLGGPLIVAFAHLTRLLPTTDEQRTSTISEPASTK